MLVITVGSADDLRDILCGESILHPSKVGLVRVGGGIVIWVEWGASSSAEGSQRCRVVDAQDGLCVEIAFKPCAGIQLGSVEWRLLQGTAVD